MLRCKLHNIFASMQEKSDIYSMICTSLHLCKRHKLCCQIYSIHCIHPIFVMNTHNMIQNYHKIIHSEWVTGFWFGMYDIHTIEFPKISKSQNMENWPSLCRCAAQRKHSRWMGISEKGALEPQEKISQQLYWINLIAWSWSCHFCRIACMLTNPIRG